MSYLLDPNGCGKLVTAAPGPAPNARGNVTYSCRHSSYLGVVTASNMDAVGTAPAAGDVTPGRRQHDILLQGSTHGTQQGSIWVHFNIVSAVIHSYRVLCSMALFAATKECSPPLLTETCNDSRPHCWSRVCNELHCVCVAHLPCLVLLI
jgi:hypothetical protein